MARVPWNRRSGARSAAAAVAAVAVLILGSASAAAGRDLTVLQPARVGERIFDFTLPNKSTSCSDEAPGPCPAAR